MHPFPGSPYYGEWTGKGGKDMVRWRYYHAFGSRQMTKRRLVGAGIAVAGGLLVLKILPLWLWPMAVGLWLIWAGLGPLIIGLALVWIGWKLFRQW